MENQTIQPEGAHQTLVVTWASLVMSQLIFFVLIYFIKPEIFRFDLTKPVIGENPIIAVLGLVAVSSVILSFILKRKYLAQSIAEQKVSLVQTAMIIACALCEVSSLLGVMTAFAFNYQYFFVFLALGIAGTILHYPTRSSIHDASYKKM